MFNYSSDNKQYHTLNYYFKEKFHKKVFKVNLNANFTCPNRDGSKGVGGCIFCSSLGSGETAGNPKDELSLQFENIKNERLKKWNDAYYVGYFQAYTNTYGDFNKIKEYYELILSQKDVVGLHISTRADCISDQMLEYLHDLSKRCDLWVELGLQSSNDKTAELLNRQHTFNDYCLCVEKLRKRNIKVCTHIINGIFFETEADMIQTVKNVVDVGIDGIKIHMLHVIKNTKLENIYNELKPDIIGRDEFVKITCKQLELIPEEVVIFRIGGDVSKDMLVAPQWTLKKFITLNEIDKYQKNNNSFQGKLYRGGSNG
ncbi:MAG: TIGR01212 family radical SAM protein [Bacilli bacterium]